MATADEFMDQMFYLFPCRPALPGQPHLLRLRGVRGHQEGGEVARSRAPPPLRRLPGGMTPPTSASECWLEEEDVWGISPDSTDPFYLWDPQTELLVYWTGRTGRTGLLCFDRWRCNWTGWFHWGWEVKRVGTPGIVSCIGSKLVVSSVSRAGPGAAPSPVWHPRGTSGSGTDPAGKPLPPGLNHSTFLISGNFWRIPDSFWRSE